VAAATALNLPLGSVYAFSVFLRPIEAALHIPRRDLALVFGMATVGFTIGSLAAPYCYRLASAAVLTLICAVAGAGGIALAATAQGLWQLFLGYGIIFGIGGGASYIVLQQGVNLLVQTRKGLVNGYLVALYPAGAMISAPLFNWANGEFGFRLTMAGLAVALLACGILAAGLTVAAGTSLAPPRSAPRVAPARGRGMIFFRLFMVFFLAAASGLTVLSQAKEIVAVYGGSTALAIGATTAITGAIACARLTGGFLTDRFPIPVVATFAHLVGLSGAVVLTLFPRPDVAAVALGMIGVGYGFVSGVTAGGVAFYWPAAEYGKIASRTYIAWCFAAISLPVLAGHLFDLTGGYTATVMIAGCGNVLGVMFALGLPRRPPEDRAAG